VSAVDSTKAICDSCAQDVAAVLEADDAVDELPIEKPPGVKVINIADAIARRAERA
jgi:hypothetical protein